MEVGLWLRSLGFEQYEAVFRENAATRTYCDLTDQDLDKLGQQMQEHFFIHEVSSLKEKEPA
jgi:hypothetical protein